MKGLISLFLAIVILGIAWGYADEGSRMMVKTVVTKNLLTIVIAIFVVAIAVFFSVNTTLRLV